MSGKTLFCVLVGLVAGCTGAFAQNANDIMNIFGGIMQSAIMQATQAEWRKLPQSELSCIDQSLRQGGANLGTIIRQGIAPSDVRLAEVRSLCKQATTHDNSSDPSFYYVANARPPDAYLSLRTNPTSVTGQRITTMPNGTVLRVLQRQDDGWWYVKVVPSGPEGWALSAIGNRKLIECCKMAADAQAFPQSNSGVNNQLSQAEQLLWDHNGSTVYLVAQGRSRKFFYKEPRPGMVSVGAKPGSLVFAGEVVGDNQYQGTAYLFNMRCGQLPYHVSGPILDSFRRVELRGQAPRIDNDCNLVGYTDDIMSFQLIEPVVSTSNEVSISTKSEPKPPSISAAAAELFKVTKEKALAGDAKAQFDLGGMYAAGRGIAKDTSESITWFRKAADQGNALAQRQLGDVYTFAMGVPEDNKEAVAWYSKSAEQGDAEAQYKLGLMYDRGVGTAKDGKQAVELFRKASSQGNADAKKRLDEVAAIKGRIEVVQKRISEQSTSVPNAERRKSLENISIRLLTASDEMPLDEIKSVESDAKVATEIFNEAIEFRKISEAANQRLATVEAELAKIYFDAPLIQEIRATIAVAKQSQADANLQSLKEALNKLNKIYDPSKLVRLKEAKNSGFDTVEAYDQFLADKEKYSKSGIRIKPH